MESRIRVLLLTLAVTLCGGCAHLHWPFHRHAKAPPTQAQQEATADAAAAAAQAAPPPTGIEPQVERRKVKGPKIRSKNVELGASVKFEGDHKFTVNCGAGFRVLPTDWLAIRIEAQDLVFKSDFLGTDRLRNNLEASLGATVYF